MTKASDNIFPSVSLVEGAAPSSPAATNFKLYFDSADHLLKWKNSAGTVSTIATGTTAPGSELDYVEITSTVSISHTTEGTADTCITGTSQAYAAVPILIEVFCPRISTQNTASASVVVLLYDGATVLGRIGLVNTTANVVALHTFYAARRLTPTAATHQYIVKAFTSSGGAGFECGAGGSGTELPAFIRITKV